MTQIGLCGAGEATIMHCETEIASGRYGWAGRALSPDPRGAAAGGIAALQNFLMLCGNRIQNRKGAPFPDRRAFSRRRFGVQKLIDIK
ncbi:hypothetical protein [Roseibium salinum]|uniref:Uncharacterized protein n=1 Tax=Roseibium salinum TaxID=1604349 RepID=A0ABT3R796_9HYPH|nr:hypothetical protein [Roseibium sp. DSM 29163]MCX2724975.1 hypothetical protein [Roseibium sp. DSM 29163]